MSPSRKKAVGQVERRLVYAAVAKQGRPERVFAVGAPGHAAGFFERGGEADDRRLVEAGPVCQCLQAERCVARMETFDDREGPIDGRHALAFHLCLSFGAGGVAAIV
jgi:hypothetical protein